MDSSGGRDSWDPICGGVLACEWHPLVSAGLRECPAMRRTPVYSLHTRGNDGVEDELCSKALGTSFLVSGRG